MGQLADFFDISLERANQFYTWGWRASVFGAAITMCGVALLWLGTRIRDHDFENNIARLHDHASASEERSKLLDQSNLKLQKEVEGERIERLKLEDRLRPRAISPDQRQAIVKMLKPMDKGPILINPAMEGEAWQFAEQIASVLKEAGFDPKDVPHLDRLLAVSQPGLFLWVKDGKKPPKHAALIRVAFSQVGIQFTGIEDPTVPDNDTVVIAISSHP